jgi:hypothetical protein
MQIPPEIRGCSHFRGDTSGPSWAPRGCQRVSGGRGLCGSESDHGIRSWYDSRPVRPQRGRREGGPGALGTCPCQRRPAASRAEPLPPIGGRGMTRGLVRRGPKLTGRDADNPMTSRTPKGECFTDPRPTPRLEAQSARVLRDRPLDRIARAVEVGGDLDRHADRPVQVRGQDVDDFLGDLDQAELRRRRGHVSRPVERPPPRRRSPRGPRGWGLAESPTNVNAWPPELGQQQAEQVAQELDGRPVPPPLGPAQVGRLVQVREYGHGPRAGGEREPD